jgi:hypothetical protein
MSRKQVRQVILTRKQHRQFKALHRRDPGLARHWVLTALRQRARRGAEGDRATRDALDADTSRPGPLTTAARAGQARTTGGEGRRSTGRTTRAAQLQAR